VKVYKANTLKIQRASLEQSSKRMDHPLRFQMIPRAMTGQWYLLHVSGCLSLLLVDSHKMLSHFRNLVGHYGW
jgi:hypothetical protein